MRAVQIDGYGGPDVLRVIDSAPSPSAPASDEVLVKIVAAGVNPLDWKIREGYMKDFIPLTFPVTLGNEFSGTVVSVGSGVTDYKPGDAVYGATVLMGAFADHAIVKADVLEKKPSNIGFAEAATLPVAIATALAALDAGEVARGTRVLIHAAAGGVGSIVLQLAKLRGAEVTALGSRGNLEFLRQLGADHVVDRTSHYEATLADFDVVIDAYGIEAQARSWKLLRKQGILVSMVAAPDATIASEQGVRTAMIFFTPNKAARSGINAHVEHGKVKATIGRTYPIAQAATALADLQAGILRGKLVLLVD